MGSTLESDTIGYVFLGLFGVVLPRTWLAFVGDPVVLLLEA